MEIGSNGQLLSLIIHPLKDRVLLPHSRLGEGEGVPGIITWFISVVYHISWHYKTSLMGFLIKNAIWASSWHNLMKICNQINEQKEGWKLTKECE